MDSNHGLDVLSELPPFDSERSSPPKVWNKSKRTVRKPRRYVASPAPCRRDPLKKEATSTGAEPSTPPSRRSRQQVPRPVPSREKENFSPSNTTGVQDQTHGGTGLKLLFQASEKTGTPTAKLITPVRSGLDTDSTRATLFSPNTMVAATTVMQLGEANTSKPKPKKVRSSKTTKRSLLHVTNQGVTSQVEKKGASTPSVNRNDMSEHRKDDASTISMPGLDELSSRAFLDFVASDVKGRIQAAMASKSNAMGLVTTLEAELQHNREELERARNLFKQTIISLDQEVQSLETRLSQIEEMRRFLGVAKGTH